jgi:hypothetical protein
MVYLALFGTGKLLLGETGIGAALVTGAALSAILLNRNISSAAGK